MLQTEVRSELKYTLKHGTMIINSKGKNMQEFASITEYIKTFPKETQVILEKVRETINTVNPDFEEAIAYGIPTFKLNGKNIVHFGGYTKHVGFYPAPSGIDTFKKELAEYQKGKGTLQFPLDQPIPYDLIARVTEYRVAEHQKKTKKM